MHHKQTQQPTQKAITIKSYLRDLQKTTPQTTPAPLPPTPLPTAIPKPMSEIPISATPKILQHLIVDNLAKSNTIPDDLPIKSTIGKYKLMNPQGNFCPNTHPAIPLLRSYATKGCPTDCGPPWTKEHIIAAIKRGPHISAKQPRAHAALREETANKVSQGFAKVVKWGDIKNNVPNNLKISPIAMIPHKSRAFRAILDLSFNLKLKGKPMPSVNDATTKRSPPQSMVQLGQSLKRLIQLMATHHNPNQPFLFSKIDIKDGFWRMNVSEEDAWNFAYVLPTTTKNTPIDDVEIVVPTALQMGWTESPPLFCAATETARDIVHTLILNKHQTLPPHPLEHLLLPPTDTTTTDKQPKQSCTNLEVYVDDFFVGTNCRMESHLLHLSRALLHGIHAIFPPPNITGHSGADPISVKKLEQGDGRWHTEKELLGWVFNGTEYTIRLPNDKATKYIKAVKTLMTQKTVPLKTFQKVTGKLQHASLGIPGGAGLFSPFYMALKGDPPNIFIGGYLRQALADWCHLLRAAANQPTSVLQLVTNKPNYIGFCDACKYGAGGVWQHGSNPLDYHVWQLEWPTDIQKRLRTADNMQGDLSINDLEMAGLLLHWLALECIAPTLHHCHVAMYCDNTSTVQWSFKLAQSKSRLASHLLRALGLRIHQTRSSPLQCLPIPGSANNMADEASRQVHSNPANNMKSHNSLEHFFNSTFPLPQHNSWNEFHLPTSLSSRVISCLRGKELTLGSWLRLPKVASGTGTNGNPMPPSSGLTRSSKTYHPSNETSWSQPLLLGSGLATTEEENKSLLAKSERHSLPSPRPLNWLENAVPSTEQTTSSTSRSNAASRV